MSYLTRKHVHTCGIHRLNVRQSVTGIGGGLLVHCGPQQGREQERRRDGLFLFESPVGILQRLHKEATGRVHGLLLEALGALAEKILEQVEVVEELEGLHRRSAEKQLQHFLV